MGIGVRGKALCGVFLFSLWEHMDRTLEGANELHEACWITNLAKKNNGIGNGSKVSMFILRLLSQHCEGWNQSHQSSKFILPSTLRNAYLSITTSCRRNNLV